MKTMETHSGIAAAGARERSTWGVASAILVAAMLVIWWFDAPLVVVGGVAFLAGVSGLGLAVAMRRARFSDRLRDLLLEAADDDPDGCFLTGAGGAVLYANAAFQRLIPELPKDGLTVAGIDKIIGGAGETGEDIFTRLAAGASAGTGGDAEVPLKRPFGKVEWRRVSVRPLTIGTEVPGGPAPQSHGAVALWRVEDVTAHREIYAVRRREEEILADCLDNLPAGFFSADGDGRMLYANRTLSEWLGVAAEDIYRQSVRFADFVALSNKVSSAGKPHDGDLHGDVTLIGAGGHTFPAALIQSQRMNERGDLVYTRSVVLRDLAWRQGADGPGGKAALQRRLRGLFDEAPVGILNLDLNGEVQDVNKAFLSFLGLHRQGVVGRALTGLINREDRSDVSAQLSKVVMGTTRAAHLEVRMPGSGQRELVMSLYAGRIEDSDGEVVGLVLHFVDTTEQKNLEIQFAQSQKIQAVGQLAGGIAHDFNNLLTGMIGFSDLLLERHGPEDPSHADIMQIRRTAERATDLVRQLLAFSRKQKLEPVNLDLTEALSDLTSLLSRLLGETIELKLEPGRNLGLVRVDPGQFDQTIINLAVNARDAMPRGGTLIIRTSDVTVDDPVQRGGDLIPAGDYVLIQVLDTGVGIAKEDIGRIFEPFFSTKEVGAGTGLGLSTVFGIVHQSGGYISVDSAPGEGTTFSIFLPRQPVSQTLQPEGENEGAVLPPPPSGFKGDTVTTSDLTGTGTVLLVEDEEAVRMFGARALRSRGYDVLVANDGEAALDVINSNGAPIQLIISDVVMPGMDGHTLIKLVRHELPDVKVILMSGYSEDAISKEIRQDTSIHFLPKPFTLKALAGKVKDVMEE